MRISIDQNDPGYIHFSNTNAVDVYLDGIKLNKCITADEEKGEVICYIEELPLGADEWPTEVLKGKVVIKGYND